MRNVLLMSLSMSLLTAGVLTAHQPQATTLSLEPALVMADQGASVRPQTPTARPAQQPTTPRPGQTGTPVAPVAMPAGHGPSGQQPPSGPPVFLATQVPAPTPRAEVIPTQNVRVELTITDSAAGQTPGVAAKKTVTMLIADGLSGRIRSSNYVLVNGSRQDLSINVDTTVKVRAEGRIQLSLTFEYSPEVTIPEGGNQPRTGTRPASIVESMSVLVTDGKSTLISQSADPASDRRVNIEVTATIVK